MNTPTQQSDTPRAAMAPKYFFSNSGQDQTLCVHVEFARTLERELSAALAECEEQARVNGMGGEREAALLAKLSAAHQQIAALQADKERLDWLERASGIHWQSHFTGLINREAIDRVLVEAENEEAANREGEP